MRWGHYSHSFSPLLLHIISTLRHQFPFYTYYAHQFRTRLCVGAKLVLNEKWESEYWMQPNVTRFHQAGWQSSSPSLARLAQPALHTCTFFTINKCYFHFISNVKFHENLIICPTTTLAPIVWHACLALSLLFALWVVQVDVLIRSVTLSFLFIDGAEAARRKIFKFIR